MRPVQPQGSGLCSPVHGLGPGMGSRGRGEGRIAGQAGLGVLGQTLENFCSQSTGGAGQCNQHRLDGPDGPAHPRSSTHSG